MGKFFDFMNEPMEDTFCPKLEEDGVRIKYKYVAGISPWTLIICVGLTIPIVYGLTWAFMQPDKEGVIVYGVILVLMAFGIRKPMNWWATYVVERNKEIEMLQLKADAEADDADEEDDKPKPKAKKQQPSSDYVFTSDDFDEKAQGLLLPMVKASRKAKMQITGEGLINAMLKSFR